MSGTPAVARFVALDRLRALAVLLMIQGHTFTALLADGALPPGVMRAHAIIHGLTAPAFLFGAGLAFGLATYPRYDAYRGGGAPLARRLRRYGGLVVLGYVLQLPGASLAAALRVHGEQLALVLRIGPLHLIALCLGVCQLGVLALRSPRAHAWAACALAVLVAVRSPAVWAAGAGHSAGPLLGPWLDGSSGSLFPIFPWASLALFGVATGGAFTLELRGSSRARLWLVPGLALVGSTYAAFLLGLRLSDPRWFWQASPLHLAFRVGLVLCAIALLHGWRRSPARPRTDASWSALLARHSLVAYVVHLLALYGSPITPSLHRRFGASLDAPAASVVCLLVLGGTWLSVRGWSWVVRERVLEPGWVRMALTLLGVFVLTR